MGNDAKNNNKQPKCRGCGSSSVKIIKDHEKNYYAGLYDLYQMPIGIDRIISDYRYHCTRCGYK